MIRYVAICIGTAAALLVAGCTSSISGTPTTAAAPSANSNSAGSGAQSALGAIDPCSLLSTNTFTSLGSGAKDTVSYSDYNQCDLTVTATAAGKPANWSVNLSVDGYFADAQSLKAVYQTSFTAKTVQNAQVFEGDTPAGGCLRATALQPNAVTLLITSRSGGNACAAADAALTSALKSIAAGSERELKLPSASLAGADLCSTFGAAAAGLLGSKPTDSKHGMHGCQFLEGANSVILTLEASSWPPAQPLPGGTMSTLGGKQVLQSVISQSGATLAQAYINAGPATVGGQGSVDDLTVFAAARGGDPAAFKQKFQGFLAALCANRLR